MNKAIFNILLYILIVDSSIAQSKSDTIYLDITFKETKDMKTYSFYGFKEYDLNKKGIATYYFKSGELYSIQEQVNGIKHGHCIWYDKSGKIVKDEDYNYNEVKDRPLRPGDDLGEGMTIDTKRLDKNSIENSQTDDSEMAWAVLDKNVIEDSLKVYTFVDEEASFPGGYPELLKFINETMTYPEDALKDSIQGRVFIQFVVESNGKVSKPKIQRGKYPSLDKEAIRIVLAMPDWKPGKINGKEVAQFFSLPIAFDLKEVVEKNKKVQTDKENNKKKKG